MTSCFHCGLPADARFSAELGQQLRAFCCPGCRAVSQLISDSGLTDFYKYRDRVSLKPAVFSTDGADQNGVDLSVYDDPEYQRDFVTDLAVDEHGGVQRLARVQLYGMNCSACAWLIEKQLEKVTAVTQARVNYSQRRLLLQWDAEAASLSELLGYLAALGFEFSPYQSSAEQRLLEDEEQGFQRRIGVAGIGMMQVVMYAMAGYFGASNATLGFLRLASLFIATAVIFYAAQPFFIGAWRALRRRHLSMDVPVALALGLAYVASLIATWTGGDGVNSAASIQTEVYFDAVCMFSFFLLISRYLEFRARSHWQIQRATPSLDDRANLIDDQGNQLQVPSRSLQKGQTILVKTGDMFPVDVCLASAQTEISQAQLTGEFSPIEKNSDDEISSGSINLGAPVRGRVLRSIDQSALSRIQCIVDRAQSHKPRISGLADQLSGYFVFVVLILAAGSYLYWLQVAPQQAFWIALSVLVVSCPCALSLATPTALTVLMNHLHRRGVLVQNSSALGKLEQIDQIVLDKTGTLTAGEFRLKWTRDLSGADGSDSDGERLQLQRAAALEGNSNHPLARAFNLDQDVLGHLNCTDWQQIDSRGIEALVEGELMRIGDQAFVEDISGASEEASKLCAQHSEKLLYLGKAAAGGEPGQMLAVFALSDQIRSGAVHLISRLKRAQPMRTISLFSGDSSAQVDRVAELVQITDVRKGLSATGKLSAIKQIQKQHRAVLAIGDGVNDAPLLAAADVSIAVCNAVDMSKQKADFILMTDDLMAISELFEYAARGKKIIVQNLSWALAYNIFMVPLAVMGLVPPWLAALGMSASSAVVVLNAFRAQISSKAAQQGLPMEQALC